MGEGQLVESEGHLDIPLPMLGAQEVVWERRETVGIFL